MSRVVKLIGVALTSLAAGVAAWLALMWVIAGVADRWHVPVAERTLAALGPLAFGPLFAAVVALGFFGALFKYTLGHPK